MKYKRELIIIIIISLLILFLKYMNILQIENGLGNPPIIILLIIFFSAISIFIQKNIDKNYSEKQINYNNLDILKYISAILIIILHLRPFVNFSDELDLAFNNIITRICVPIFFIITGYFVAIKEKDNPNYIKDYIKKTIPLYLIWSAIYIPIIIGYIIKYIPLINDYLSKLNLSIPLLILLIILLLPIAIIIALVYTGVYYHLWYFPALILSLIVLNKWKKRFNIKYLLIISFFLLIFGATETYYGMLPFKIKELVTLYYNIFFTTRNFLFFGLFYVVLGYFIGLKKQPYSKYCFLKFVICFFLLIFEAIFLHDIERLNSNILLSCVPLTYYLFIFVIYLTKQKSKKSKFNFRSLSKYYYLVHPFVIAICFEFLNIKVNPYIQILITIIITHIISYLLITVKKKYNKLII